MLKKYPIESTGLTLVEILVTISIAGVLVSLAAPSFVSMTQKFRLMGEASSILSAMTFARSEAIKRGIPVSVCSSADGSSCLDSNTWEKGWIVCTDPGAKCTGNNILKVQSGLKNTDTITPNDATTFVIFNRDGFTSTSLFFKVQGSQANAAGTQCVAINNTGLLKQAPANASGGCP